MDIALETDIPVPLSRKGSKKRDPSQKLFKYPWDKMEVGQSFFLETSTPGKLINTLTASAAYFKRINNRPELKFIIRKQVGEKETHISGIELGVRVWRIE